MVNRTIAAEQPQRCQGGNNALQRESRRRKQDNPRAI